MTNSRAKGKRVELDARDFLHRLGFGPCRRSAQVAGYLTSDIVCEGLPCVHIEVKGVQGMFLGSKLWTDAVEQTIRDSTARGMVGVLLFKGNRQPFRLTVPTADDWPTWVREPDIARQLSRLRALR